MQKQFNISWMHCSSCALIIENSLKELPWVKTANVNFAAEKASLIFDEDSLKEDEIINLIKKIWYWASQTSNDNSQNQEIKNQEISNYFNKFLFSMIFSAPMLYFMILDFFPWFLWWNLVMPYMGIVSLILTIPVQFYAWLWFYKWMWSSLKMKTFNMDSLIAIGTSTAFFFSLVNYLNYAISNKSLSWINWMKIPELYFETAAFLITFVLLWKYLEIKAKWKTSEAIKKLMWLQAKTARIIKDWITKDIPIEEVQHWDIVQVRPWEKIPVDGKISKWSSSIDESMLTWESIPVDKNPWDTVIWATINKTWTFEFEATKVWSETMLSQIIKLIEEAQWSKAPIQAFADRIASWFVPAVIWTAILTFIVWFLVLDASLAFSLLAFTSVIVIACPCALGLATPTAIMVWTWKWAENWILIKWWEPLEAAQNINAIIFDKTWTLTKGKPEVTDVVSLSSSHEVNIKSEEEIQYSEDDILRISASIEKLSEHSLAEAIYKHAEQKWIKLEEVDNFQAVPGHWVVWTIKWIEYLFGNRKHTLITAPTTDTESKIANLEHEWKTVMILAIKNLDQIKILWFVAVADTVKETSKEAVERLTKMWIEIFMVTWDNLRTANAIASQIWITNVIAEVLPESKAIEVKKLQEQWKKVAMVWDWINDSPALAQADLWIAMWSWTDVAMEAWWIVIIKNDLNDVITAIQLSRETMSKIRQNMFFALFYNVIGIPVAARVFVDFGLVLKPELAGLAMALSSISVVLNSLLLKNFRPWKINHLSSIAPFIMIIIFTYMFWQFAMLW